MNCNEIRNSLANYKKGTYIALHYSNIVSNARASKQNIVIRRDVQTVCRLNIQYANTAYAKARANEPKKTYTIWWHHDDASPYIIHHNTKAESYLQVYQGARPNQLKVTYTMNGTKVSKSYLLEQGLINKSSTTDSVLYNIKVGDLISIGKDTGKR